MRKMPMWKKMILEGLILFSILVLPILGEAQTVDAPTEAFQELLQSPEALSTEELTHIKDQYHIILVAGFFSNIMGKAEDSKHFIEQKAWLKEKGFSYEVAEIKSQSACEVNIPIIHGLIKKSARPVILIGHSKGGVDILSTLIQYPEHLEGKKVAGVVALQSPFKGTPLAESLYQSSFAYALAGTFISICGGEFKTLESLSTGFRLKFLGNKKAEIENILKQIPFVTVGTRVSPNPFPMAKYFFNDNQDNDGVVPTESAHLPGTHFITLDKVTHLDTIAPPPSSRQDEKPLNRISFLKAILKTVHDQMAVTIQERRTCKPLPSISDP